MLVDKTIGFVSYLYSHNKALRKILNENSANLKHLSYLLEYLNNPLSILVIHIPTQRSWFMRSYLAQDKYIFVFITALLKDFVFLLLL